LNYFCSCLRCIWDSKRQLYFLWKKCLVIGSEFS
jgi:hypothetical protein